jgi:hypothetical protein
MDQCTTVFKKGADFMGVPTDYSTDEELDASSAHVHQSSRTKAGRKGFLVTNDLCSHGIW